MLDLIKLLVLGFLLYIGFNLFIEKKSIEETTNKISKTFNTTKFSVAEKLLKNELRKKIPSYASYDRIECFKDVEYGLSCKVYNFTDNKITSDVILYDVMAFGLQQASLYNLLDLDLQIGIENIEISDKIGNGFAEKMLKGFNKNYDDILIKIKTSSDSQRKFNYNAPFFSDH